MPRISGTSQIFVTGVENPLLEELARELKSERRFGWPLIIETPIPVSQAKTVLVIWDQWQPYNDDFRIHTVLGALERADGPEAVKRVAAVEALTIPEARDSDRLPFSILALRRKDDPVSEEQCRDAMIQMGGSILEDPRRPDLRFPSEAMAEECRLALIQELPGSDDIWSIAFDGRPGAHRAAFLPRR